MSTTTCKWMLRAQRTWICTQSLSRQGMRYDQQHPCLIWSFQPEKRINCSRFWGRKHIPPMLPQIGWARGQVALRFASSEDKSCFRGVFSSYWSHPWCYRSDRLWGSPLSGCEYPLSRVFQIGLMPCILRIYCIWIWSRCSWWQARGQLLERRFNYTNKPWADAFMCKIILFNYSTYWTLSQYTYPVILDPHQVFLHISEIYISIRLPRPMRSIPGQRTDRYF